MHSSLDIEIKKIPDKRGIFLCADVGYLVFPPRSHFFIFGTLTPVPRLIFFRGIG
ncbi:hypothetical protein HZB94_00530 [Candidatus Falkowbacteria bacterium]|nr:hypothetical protein [Candidatus Falkowbacteria bacterium]